MTPLTAEKIAELEGLPAMWRDAAELLHSGPASGAFDTCADELERLIAPFISLAKRVAGAPVVEIKECCSHAVIGSDWDDDLTNFNMIGKRVALLIVGGEE